MKTQTLSLSTVVAPLLSLSLMLPLTSSCASAQNSQNQQPKRKQGQNANGQNKRNQNRPNANRVGANRPDEAFANMELPDNPNAGEDFPFEAPQNVSIPTTNYAPPANAIFVSPDAKGGGAGTMEAPTSLQNALKSAPVGATIVLRGGTYRVGELFLPRRLTLQAYPGESPWINGSVVVSDWVKEGDLWRHGGWTAQFKPEGRLDRIIDKTYPMAVYGDQAFLDGKALFQVGSREQVKPGRFFVDWDKDALYIGDDPTGKTVEGTTQEVGLTIAQSSGNDVAGSMVRGIGITHFAQFGMTVAAPRVTIENCALVWNANAGMRVQPAGGAGGTQPANCVLRGNVVLANGQVGVRAGRAPNLLVEKNNFSYNNVEGFRLQWGASGFKCFGFEGLMFRDNLVEHNNGNGMWMDVNANKATVVRNVARYNAAGIFFEVSDQAIIAFNVCQGNTIGVHLSNSQHARVYNNTLVDNRRAIRVYQGARVNNGHEGGLPDDTTVANTPPGGTFTARGHVINNNIFWTARPDAQYALFDFDISPKQPQQARRSGDMVIATSHNAYHRADPARPQSLQAWSKDGGVVKRYNTLEEFTAASGKGQNSLVTTGADVYFADAAQGDFRLKPNSPAVGKAEPLPQDIAQAAGVNANIGYLGALPPA
jgi:parallel beta-helix repeat protein